MGITKFNNITRLSNMILSLLLILSLTNCAESDPANANKPNQEVVDETGSGNEDEENNGNMGTHLTTNNYVRDIVNHPAFEGFGDLLLTRDNNSSYYDTPLSNIGSLMPYHSNVRPDVVLGALNHLIDEVKDNKTVFYDIYTEQQKQQDPAKRNTGIFFYRGNPNAPFAVVCPGGGFSYVGSLHEGFPLAQVISEKGYNAFVIRYRIGGEQIASEDLAAALSFIFRNASSLEVSTENYSLWGGSAGGRMVGNIAMYGASYFGYNVPKPGTAVIIYTGQTSYSADFPPTFLAVSANDGIASPSVMEQRSQNLRSAGVDVEFHKYQSSGHGFGVGTGTDAQGWMDHAVRFWEKYITK
ncbi:acetyl esterase/lipase [Dysgonomonas alginatilytica]|uniref:Acetyl esterase/lipase n=1 Tax=Dysgonomonas alginatilytica TaxID=1605892 RepID=A0A2V3PKE9_9BACT|nr:alpha/beta hydrolase [Dysgonomonas alginatilytica]PXV59384.1 acetyl esterase/lipase [Dysgonomonas alginatilytica]